MIRLSCDPRFSAGRYANELKRVASVARISAAPFALPRKKKKGGGVPSSSQLLPAARSLSASPQSTPAFRNLVHLSQLSNSQGGNSVKLQLIPPIQTKIESDSGVGERSDADTFDAGPRNLTDRAQVDSAGRL